jgi:hypothetical protein
MLYIIICASILGLLLASAFTWYLKEKEELEAYVSLLKKEKLLVAKDNVEQKQKLILDLLGETLKTCNVKNGDRYRRKDIILSILEEV